MLRKSIRSFCIFVPEITQQILLPSNRTQPDMSRADILLDLMTSFDIASEVKAFKSRRLSFSSELVIFSLSARPRISLSSMCFVYPRSKCFKLRRLSKLYSRPFVER